MNAPKEDPFRLTGSVLEGRYRVDAVVAEGGFGVVYRGFHLAFESPIAIKVLKLPARLSEPDRASFLDTFRSEGKILFDLSRLHAGFVRPIEAGFVVTVDSVFAPFLVLEWLEGRPLDRDLYSRRRSGAPRPTLEDVIAELTPIAEALSIAHDRGVAHRDVKPANVFLTPSGAKLLDFGIAKVMADGTLTAAPDSPTTSGVGAFTPSYAAPEQWLRKLGSTGPWTDVYAFALVFVERMTGKPALIGDDAQQLMGATLDAEDRPLPSSRGATVSKAVDAVFRRALAVDPHARYRSMKTFWSSLLAAARGLADEETVTGESDGPPALPALAPAPTTLPSAAARSADPAFVSDPTELAAGGAFPMTTRGVSRPNVPPPRSTSNRALPAILLGMLVASAAAVYWIAARDPTTTNTPPAPPPPPPVPPPSSPCPPEMALIRSATFSMGSESGEPDEKPVHAVSITAFCMDRTEMTRADYLACKRCKEPIPGTDAAPVVGVDHASATLACESREKRLPTEAEWELAARGAEGRLYPWGNEIITCERAAVARAGTVDCGGGLALPGSHAIGATPEGLQDMGGNVWEWVADFYGVYPTGSTADPTGPANGSMRIVRGGSWSQAGTAARATNRAALGKNERLPDTGFRCAKKAHF